MELLERNGRIEAILLSARNVVRQRLLVCRFIDCLVKMHSKVRNGGLERNATSTYICRLAADRTDSHWWTYKHHLIFSCVKLQFVALYPWQSIAYTGLNVGLSRSEIARWCTVREYMTKKDGKFLVQCALCMKVGEWIEFMIWLNQNNLKQLHWLLNLTTNKLKLHTCMYTCV